MTGVETNVDVWLAEIEVSAIASMIKTKEDDDVWLAETKGGGSVQRR